MSEGDLLTVKSRLLEDDNYYGAQIEPMSAFCESIESSEIDEIISKFEEHDKYDDFDGNISLFDGISSLLESDFNTDAEDLKQKCEEFLRTQKAEHEAIVRQKDDEIDALRREIDLLKTSQQKFCLHALDCKCGKKSFLDSETIRDLKTEFRKSLDNLAERRRQCSELQNQNTKLSKTTYELRRKVRELEKCNESQKCSKITEEVELQFRQQYEKELAKSLQSMEETKQREMAQIERSFKERLDNYVTLFALRLQDPPRGETSPISDDFEMDENFEPLLKLWSAMVSDLNEKARDLDRRRQTMEEARENLEEALHATRSIESTSTNTSALSEHFKDELAKMRRESVVLKEKLDKYKRHYHRLVAKHEQEIENLKGFYSEKLAELEIEHREREEHLIRDLTSASEAYKRVRLRIPDPR